MGSTLSPTRTKSTWKPRVEDGDVCFIACEGGAALWLGDCPALLELDAWRSPIVALPACQAPSFQRVEEPGERTSSTLAPLSIVEGSKFDSVPLVRYRFTGGFDSAALEVRWDEAGDDGTPRWAALKTFTGMQVKYVTPGKRPPLVFALADEDAYCYCDHDPCEECVANCRRGFVLYALFEGVGIVRVACGRT